MHRRNNDANLVEIHVEFTEMVDKQVYVQLEYLLEGSRECILK